MTPCPALKRGRSCKRPLGHGGLHVYNKLAVKRVRRVEYEKQRRYVFARANSKCEARTEACTGNAEQTHHMLRRSQGGTDEPGNLLAVCSACHDWIHAHPSLSFEHGWLYRSTIERT